MNDPISHPPFRKILIANRGEIAQRLIHACHELGVVAVALYSEADAGAPWVRLADEAYPLRGATAADSYLNQEAIFTIARRSGAEAIHPGYGFLSENAEFAQACADRGFVFIGPGPEAIRQMGSKAIARELAQQAGVPVAPGIDAAGMSPAELETAVSNIPYPILVKASAGGGGKGMRVIWQPDELADGVRAARSEAKSAFGDDHILVEKYFTEIHHVEIQILADAHGHVLHLFERECSVQRRHQKIIEESPAPIIRDDALRQQMAAAAVSLAAAVGYVNAGTVEFIVDGEGRFYFLEMNTRLQVEHPVTELVTGLDIAAWQIRIAAGERLPFTQDALAQRGHAVECRIYAEDPARQFLPSIGTITTYRRPIGPGVRVDDSLASGTAVTPYYDPMLAKLITWGRDRAEALRKMRRALQEMVVLGVTTNIPYLLAILDEPDFVAGHTATNYLETHFEGWQPDMTPDALAWLAAAVFERVQGGGKVVPGAAAANETEAARPAPWQSGEGWRNVPLA